MKYTILSLVILILASCSSPDSEKSIRDQIAKKKQEVLKLNQEIEGLEANAWEQNLTTMCLH